MQVQGASLPSVSTTERYAGQNCSIARTLSVVGERWTLLVIRELSLGRTRFGEIRDEIGVSTNVLTDRLEALVEQGVVSRSRVKARGTVFDYELTAKGRDLLPVLTMLMRWGDRHAAGELGAPRVIEHLSCGHVTAPVLACSHCHEPLSRGGTRILPGPGADERQQAQGPLPAAAAG